MGNPSEPKPPNEVPDHKQIAEQNAAAEKAAAGRTAAQHTAMRVAEANVAVAEAAAAQLRAAQALAETKTAEARAAATEVDTPKLHEAKAEPKLRHEFVGMMFALAIGEVAIQTAVLIRGGNWVHFLPAYSHLFLTAMLIAASWVGWTLSPSPGARKDVQGVFQMGFLVLLIDVFLVVVYFILAKTVDITGEGSPKLKASAHPESVWILVIFATYFVWDILTKIVIYLVERRTEPWFRNYGSRMIPTIICLGMAWIAKPLFDAADAPHVLTADLALLSLVMLFRALKGLVDSLTKPNIPRKVPFAWTVVCIVGFALGAIWTSSYPVPRFIADQILATPKETNSDIEKPPVKLPSPLGPNSTKTHD
jgi:hypothetical protein